MMQNDVLLGVRIPGIFAAVKLDKHCLPHSLGNDCHGHGSGCNPHIYLLIFANAMQCNEIDFNVLDVKRLVG
jgi:hypothetical protein